MVESDDHFDRCVGPQERQRAAQVPRTTDGVRGLNEMLEIAPVDTRVSRRRPRYTLAGDRHDVTVDVAVAASGVLVSHSSKKSGVALRSAFSQGCKKIQNLSGFVLVTT